LVLLEAIKVFVIINMVDFFDEDMVDYNNDDVMVEKNISFLVNSMDNVLVTFSVCKKVVIKVYKRKLNVLREKGLFLLILLVCKYYK